MTEALLLIICEEGWVDFEALARAGGCNRSLYGVCEKALRPAVRKKRFRLFRKIERAALERVRAYELAELCNLEVGNETWEDRVPMALHIWTRGGGSGAGSIQLLDRTIE